MRTPSRIALLLFSIVFMAGVGDVAAARRTAPRPVQKVKQKVKEAWARRQNDRKVDKAIDGDPQLSKFRGQRIAHYMKDVPPPTVEPLPIPSGGYYMAKLGEAKRQARADTVTYAAKIGRPIQ